MSIVVAVTQDDCVSTTWLNHIEIPPISLFSWPGIFFFFGSVWILAAAGSCFQWISSKKPYVTHDIKGQTNSGVYVASVDPCSLIRKLQMKSNLACSHKFVTKRKSSLISRVRRLASQTSQTREEKIQPLQSTDALTCVGVICTMLTFLRNVHWPNCQIWRRTGWWGS